MYFSRFSFHLFFQGCGQRSKNAVTLEMEASENPTLASITPDPTLFCTAFKKNRFYMFSRRGPDDIKSQDADRDIFNEKPSKEDIISATEGQGDYSSFINFLKIVIYSYQIP